MDENREYSQRVARLRGDLLTDITAAYLTAGGGKQLFEEPWHIGPALNDTRAHEAGGIEQQGQWLVILNTRDDESYLVDKLHIDDLIWVLNTLEDANKYRARATT